MTWLEAIVYALAAAIVLLMILRPLRGIMDTPKAFAPKEPAKPRWGDDWEREHAALMDKRL